MVTGKQLVDKAATRINDKYAFVPVPKNNPNWTGPWDCAEIVSWAAYQLLGKLYGCVDNNGDPATVEAYSGSWAADARSGRLPPTTLAHAMTAPGIIVVRRPGMHGFKYGHVAISDGAGKVVEAAGIGLGVRRYALSGRIWDYIVMLPDVQYAPPGAPVAQAPMPRSLRLQDPWLKDPLVKKVQRALKDAGYNPGPIDGEFGPNTASAVIAFQNANRLVADGIVGPKTGARLGLEWPQA